MKHTIRLHQIIICQIGLSPSLDAPGNVHHSLAPCENTTPPLSLMLNDCHGYG